MQLFEDDFYEEDIFDEITNRNTESNCAGSGIDFQSFDQSFDSKSEDKISEKSSEEAKEQQEMLSLIAKEEVSVKFFLICI